MYQWPQPSFNQYPPYWGFPPFPPIGFGGALLQYLNTNPWNLGFTNRPMGGFQPHLGTSNIPPQFPGGYALNWPSNSPPPMNFPPGPLAYLGMDHQAHQETTHDRTHPKGEHHIIITLSIKMPQDSITSHLTSNTPMPSENISNVRTNC